MLTTEIMLLINLLIAPNPRHWLTHNENAKADIAEQCQNAEEQTGIEASFLVFRIFLESTFHPDAKGKKGELGYLQIMKRWYPFCLERGAEPGSILCGAMLFQEGKRLCGDGFETWYATGECKSDNPKWIRRLNFRRRFAEQKTKELKERVK